MSESQFVSGQTPQAASVSFGVCDACSSIHILFHAADDRVLAIGAVDDIGAVIEHLQNLQRDLDARGCPPGETRQ